VDAEKRRGEAAGEEGVVASWFKKKRTAFIQLKLLKINEYQLLYFEANSSLHSVQ
jgi:hypothetical protein